MLLGAIDGSGCGSDGVTRDQDAGVPRADGAADPEDAGPAPSFSFESLPWDGPRARVTALAFLPDTVEPLEMLVLERDGVVYHYALEDGSAAVLGSFVPPGVYADQDCGLISAVFDPDFSRNRFLYLGYCVDEQHSGIFRFEFDSSRYDRIAESVQEIVVLGDERAERPWHNVGALGFEPEGVLWALFGDKTVRSTAQDRDNDLGALLRIVPNRDPAAGGYLPAADNPWAEGGGSPDIYAFGFRSPWKGIRDRRGWYWVGDVGSEIWEEVNVVTAPGQNFGWPTAEGPCERDCEGLIDPTLAWQRGGPEPYIDEDPDAEATGLRVVWVGPEVRHVPHGPYGGHLRDAVLFGDFCVGFVRAVELDNDGQVVRDQPIAHLAHVASLAQASDGTIYGATHGSCTSDPDDQVSRLVRLVMQ